MRKEANAKDEGGGRKHAPRLINGDVYSAVGCAQSY